MCKAMREIEEEFSEYKTQHFAENHLHPLGDGNIQIELYFEQRKYALEFEISLDILVFYENPSSFVWHT